jgi:hypothetical protein
MNYLVVGKNGSGKSYFCVKITKDFDEQNKINISSNSLLYSKNYEILKDRDIDQLLKDFSLTLEQLVLDNIKVYSQYKDNEDFLLDLALFQNLEDAIVFDDYFRFHLIYNDFIKYVLKIHVLKLEFLKPVHKLYSDINGLKIDGVEKSPDDWRTAPLGSKIFYDEFQDRPEFLFDGNRPSKNPMILELSKIRHYDIDLYLITPDSDNLHKSLRKIIHVMYFVKRPHGNPQCCSVYTFDQFLSNPRAAADSKREPRKYSEYELLNYKKSIQRLYTSAANHSSMKFQIPWKWIRNASLIIIGFVIIISMLFKIPIFGFFVDAFKGMMGGDSAVKDIMKPNLNPTEKKSASNASQSQQTQSTNTDLTNECRKAVNVEKPECVQWFNDLSKNGSSVNSSGQVVQTVSYNPNKPYDFEYQPQVQPTDFPRMSGVIQLSTGKLIALDQQGNYMQNVSQQDCQKWLSGYRPFNYFAQNQNEQRERSVPEQAQSKPEISSL